MSRNVEASLTESDRRARILAAARQSLTAKGFHRTTIDDICRTSLMPKSVVQRLFLSKDALISEAMLDTIRQTLDLARAILREDGSEPGAVHRLMQMITPILKAPAFFQSGRGNVEWWAWAARNETGLEGFRESWREWREVLATLVRSDVGEGPSDEDVAAIASLMLAIFNGLILHATLEGDELDIDKIMRFQQLGLDGIFSSVKEQNGETATASQEDSSGAEEPHSAKGKQ